MIGSLIYYGLYPLSKLLTTLSELWWKSHPVFINGKGLWDCDGRSTSRRLNEQQSVLLDRWCSTASGLSETPKSTNWKGWNTNGLVGGESVLEIIKDTEENCQSHNLNAAMFHKDREQMSVKKSMKNDPEPSNKENASSLVLEQDSDLVEEQDAGMECDNMSRLLPNRQDLSSAIQKEALGAVGMVLVGKGEKPVVSALTVDRRIPFHTNTHQVAALSTDTLDITKLSKTKEGGHETMSFKTTPECDDTWIHFAYTSPVEVTQVGAITNENQLEDQMERNTGEIKDPVGAATPMYSSSAPLADDHVQTINDQTWLQSAPPYWHFPVGLGLSEMTHSAYNVQVPSLSYYHTVQDNNCFEVIWRVWEDLSQTDDAAFKDQDSKFHFTVMSYNILAQDLLKANSKLYAHCSEDVLAWEYRFQTILKELQTWEPDIICLQEVQENHYQEQMQPALTEMGYNCVYKRRTGTKTDGCAVCYNAKRFTQLSVSLLEFQRNECELLDRDNVGIVLLLQPTAARSNGLAFRPICVANTHLLFNPRRGDVKLAQIAIVLAEIDKVVKQCRVKGHDCEVILCGDLNCIPNMPLYELIVTGRLYFHGMPVWVVSGQEDLSYKTYHRRLYAPLWPSSLGINDNCQYSDVSEPHIKESGKRQYNHDFLRQLRYCSAACARPTDLELIPGITDIIPKPGGIQQFAPRRFRNTICHSLNLSSVYNQNITGTAINAVTTLHSDGASMVDYIFFSRQVPNEEKGLKLLGRLALLSEADLWSRNGLPSQIFPSDHLSLMAEFQLS